MTSGWLFWSASAMKPAITASQPSRSESVNGIPADILTMLASGWCWSPSMKRQPSASANPCPTLDLPQPHTPMTTTMGGPIMTFCS